MAGAGTVKLAKHGQVNERAKGKSKDQRDHNHQQAKGGENADDRSQDDKDRHNERGDSLESSVNSFRQDEREGHQQDGKDQQNFQQSEPAQSKASFESLFRDQSKHKKDARNDEEDFTD